MADAGLASIEDLKLRLARLGVTLEETSPVRHRPAVPEIEVNLSPGRRPVFSPKSPFSTRTTPGAARAVARDEVADILERCEKLEDQLNHKAPQSGSPTDSSVPSQSGGIPYAPIPYYAPVDVPYVSPIRYRPYTAPPVAAGKAKGKSPGRAKKKSVQDVATAAAAAVHTAAAAARAHRQYGVTGRLKEEEMVWAQERVALRRELTQTKKRAVAAEGQLKKLQAVHGTIAAENKELRQALRGRDRALLACERRLDELEGLRAQVHEEAGARVAAAEAERDNLKAMMGVTLHRLERVERVALEMERKGEFISVHMKGVESDHYLALQAAKAARLAVESSGDREKVNGWHDQVINRLNRLQHAMSARVDV